MTKLYYENQYLCQADTEIINVKKSDDKYYIELKDDIFFPGGGGQRRDFGTIDGITVQDIIEEDDKIIYILNKKPSTKKVLCIIDWKNRFDYMQQHLSQHVLSGSFYKLFNANTAGIHLGKEISYVDIVGKISKNQILEAEIKANDIIHENRKVIFEFTDRKGAEAMNLRRKLQTDDEMIRVVQIEDFDINACCGVHPSRTLELQMIKIINSENHKGNTRIFFLAGDRAVKYSLNTNNMFDDVCNRLTTGKEDITKTIDNLINTIEGLKEENKIMEQSILINDVSTLMNESKAYKNLKVIFKEYSDKNNKYLLRLSNELTKGNDIAVFFVNIKKNQIYLIYQMSKNIQDYDMSNLLKASLNIFDGKGGGNKYLAQGFGVIENGRKEIIKNIFLKIDKSL